MELRSFAIALATLVVLGAYAAAPAGPLLTTDKAATQGTVNVVDPGVPGFSVWFDYAVFSDDGSFQLFADEEFGAGAYPGLPGDDEYIYAYQANVTSSTTLGIATLGVGLDPGVDVVADESFLGGTGVDPSLINPTPSAIRWQFGSPTALTSGGTSSILYFSSEQPWELDNVNIGNFSGANEELVDSVPSPLPEPAAAVLLSAGILIIARRRRHRNAT